MLTPIPPIVLEQYQRLYDLCVNSKNGRIDSQSMADFMGCDKNWLLRATFAGGIPFAVGTDKGVGKGSACYNALAVFQFFTQGSVLNTALLQQTLKKTQTEKE